MRIPTFDDLMDVHRLKYDIIDAALAEGFGAVAVTRPDIFQKEADRLRHYLAQNYHGTMQWMDNERRFSPELLWPEAKSVIMLAMNYGLEENPLDNLAHNMQGNISVYARGADYHDVMKKKLKRLARQFAIDAGADVKIFVDTAPLMEKPLAQAAGLGWQGKHSNMVSREFGSWCFLGSIFTTALLPPDKPMHDHCGSCRACLDICPTNAFPAPYQVDARRCISYLTIEYKGVIAPEFRRAMGNRIYGCDDCLAVCPWNKYAQRTTEAKLFPREENNLPLLEDLVTLDEAGFRKRFRASPIKRTGYARFMRNVLIALGNSGTQNLAPIEARLSDEQPLIRGMAIWALGACARARAVFLRENFLPTEPDEAVRREWEAVGL